MTIAMAIAVILGSTIPGLLILRRRHRRGGSQPERGELKLLRRSATLHGLGCAACTVASAIAYATGWGQLAIMVGGLAIGLAAIGLTLWSDSIEIESIWTEAGGR